MRVKGKCKCGRAQQPCSYPCPACATPAARQTACQGLLLSHRVQLNQAQGAMDTAPPASAQLTSFAVLHTPPATASPTIKKLAGRPSHNTASHKGQKGLVDTLDAEGGRMPTPAICFSSQVVLSASAWRMHASRGAALVAHTGRWIPPSRRAQPA